MKPAPKPSDEAERLAILRSYQILDTAPEETFDRIARLAQRMLDVPIALVSLIDAERQWFKATIGLHVRETPRTEAFCAHAILDQGVLVIPDTHEDPRFSANPHVIGGPKIRFYAGAPLRPQRCDSAIGTLCVLDVEPREPTERDLENLRELAAVVEDELELRRTRRLAQEQLPMFRLSEQVAGVGHWSYDRLERCLAWSQETARIHGVDPETHQPSAEDALERVHEDDRARLQEAIAHALEHGKSYSIDYRIVRPDGEVRRVHARGLIDTRTQEPTRRIFGTVHDITDRYELEEQVRQAERLASIGTLAAGVAHEINNPLTYMQANLDALREDGDETEREELCDEIKDGLDRIARIVAGLKTFSRAHPEGSREETVELTLVVENAVRLCRNELQHRAALIVDPGHDVAPVLGDEAQLVQVAVNLLLNAGQAIPQGQASDHEIRIAVGARDENSVYFEVTDSGSGMDEATVAQAFSPFFTTKSDAEGTGLGLSISHRIVEAHRGRVEVDSKVGRGTRVRVVLPAASRATARPLSTDPPPSSAPEHWRVLVIDDDALVRKALVRLLRGHAVDVEHDARRVLERMDQSEVEYDAILCDLMMPSMTGWDFHAMLAERAPAYAKRIVFVTGGAFTPEGRRFVERSDVRVLTKPIDGPTLQAALREVVSPAD